MKKLFFSTTLLLLCSISIMAQDVKLPAPEHGNNVSLYDALAKRKSIRKMQPTPLTEQQLANLLWCANGVNREDGRRTAPSARNCQEIELYVFTEKGVFLYNPIENTLIMQQPEDHRAMVGPRNTFAAEAPVILVFVANYDKMKSMDEAGCEFYGATDAGYVSQNVYLYCAVEDLATVVLGSIDRDGLKKLLGFNGKAVLAQPVAYPEK